MKINIQISPFRRTKLHRPLLGKDHLHRQHLLDRLNQGLYRPLTLVSAPAGYGKSTLISSWLGITDIPGAWLSLDRQDNDLRQFLFGFLATLQSIFPEAGKDVQAMVSAPSLPPLRMLADHLINNMDLIERHFILVLDDFHLINDKSIIEFLQELLRHPPRHMHLILVGRKDPFLPISTLRARDLITEVRINDLRFTEWEVKEFLKIALADRVGDTTAIELTERTEGWVTGIRLAVLASRGQEDSITELFKLKGTTAYVMDYLIAEVLNAQPQIIRHFLLVTSILDHFTGALCDALSRQVSGQGENRIDGADFIEKLKSENLFLITLDTENCWFRYHHLFQELLQSQLKLRYSSEEIAALHSRAGEWYTKNGFRDEAIQHKLAGGDVTGAIQLFEQNRQLMLNSNRWHVFEKWLSMFPDSIIQQQPELMLAQVWVHYFQYRHALIPPILDSVESLLSDDPKEQPLYGETYLFKGVNGFMRGDFHSLENIEGALERIPVEYHMVRGFAETYFGLTGQMQGQKDRVVHELSELLNDWSIEVSRKVRVLTSLVWIHIISGELTVAAHFNKQLTDVATHNADAAWIAWSSYNQGLIHFHRNEPDVAIHYLCQAAENAYLMLRRATVDCMAGLTMAYQATQQTDKASTTLGHLYDFIRPFNDPTLSDIADSFRARLSLMRGETAFVSEVLSKNKAPQHEAMAIWLEVPAITQCRVLIAEGSDNCLQEAEKKLQELLSLNQAHHNTCQVIGIMVLQALAIHRQGRLDESLDVLEQAVAMSELGPWIRPFVESGPPMANLLRGLRKRNVAVDYIDKLLAEFRDYELGSMPNASTPDIILSPSKAAQPLVEPLSNRELEVLALLAQRLQTKEIAGKLFISPETVKTHLRNIYQKLRVNSRRQAVDRATDIGILSSP